MKKVTETQSLTQLELVLLQLIQKGQGNMSLKNTVDQKPGILYCRFKKDSKRSST